MLCGMTKMSKMHIKPPPSQNPGDNTSSTCTCIYTLWKNYNLWSICSNKFTPIATMQLPMSFSAKILRKSAHSEAKTYPLLSKIHVLQDSWGTVMYPQKSHLSHVDHIPSVSLSSPMMMEPYFDSYWWKRGKQERRLRLLGLEANTPRHRGSTR